MDVMKKGFHTLFPNLTTWYIDNTPKTDGIERIEEKPHISENIFHFFAFIETLAPVYFILDTPSDNSFLYESGLAVGSIQDRPFTVVRNL